MPSVDTLIALATSPETWETYRSSFPGQIDLRLAQLQDMDLRGRSFFSCDLSGAELDGANLDRCEFLHTSLQDTSMRNTSLVSCTFAHVHAKSTDFSFAIIRDSEFSDVDFDNANFAATQITGCTLEKCRIVESSMEDVRFSNSEFLTCVFRSLDDVGVSFVNCRFSNTQLADIHWREATLSESDLSSASILDVQLSNGTVADVRILRSNVTRLSLAGTLVSNIDLTESTLREMNLVEVGLGEATMLGTAFVRCIWPVQRAIVTWSGRYQRPADLLGQPVQDVRGLSPSLRREIADAQYLHELSGRASTPLRAGAFRVWGATTAYGQSVARLSIVTALLIVASAGALTLLDGQITGWPQTLSAIPKAIAVVATTFLGIEGPDPVDANAVHNALLFVVRLGGFVVLGLWIGLAANMLGRLSSQ